MFVFLFVNDFLFLTVLAIKFFFLLLFGMSCTHKNVRNLLGIFIFSIYFASGDFSCTEPVLYLSLSRRQLLFQVVSLVEEVIALPPCVCVSSSHMCLSS